MEKQGGLISGILAFLVGIYLWFSTQDIDAYIFPKMIGISLFCLGILLTVQSFRKIINIPLQFSLQTFKKEIVYIMGIILFIVLAEVLGMYVSSALLVFGILIASSRDKKLINKISYAGLITLISLLVIYGLFTLLLQVQTPQGLLF